MLMSIEWVVWTIRRNFKGRTASNSCQTSWGCPRRPRCLPRKVFGACPSGMRPWDRPMICWRYYISQLVWEDLNVPPEDLVEIARERSLWVFILRLSPLRPETMTTFNKSQSESQTFFKKRNNYILFIYVDQILWHENCKRFRGETYRNITSFHRFTTEHTSIFKYETT